jgi:ribosomal protein L37E
MDLLIATTTLGLVVIAACMTYLYVSREPSEIFTERSTAHYVCRQCGEHVNRGTTLKYIYEQVLCSACFLSNGARLRPPDGRMSRRRGRSRQQISPAMTAMAGARGGALLVSIKWRRS